MLAVRLSLLPHPWSTASLPVRSLPSFPSSQLSESFEGSSLSFPHFPNFYSTHRNLPSVKAKGFFICLVGTWGDFAFPFTTKECSPLSVSPFSASSCSQGNENRMPCSLTGARTQGYHEIPETNTISILRYHPSAFHVKFYP